MALIFFVSELTNRLLLVNKICVFDNTQKRTDWSIWLRNCVLRLCLIHLCFPDVFLLFSVLTAKFHRCSYSKGSYMSVTLCSPVGCLFNGRKSEGAPRDSKRRKRHGRRMLSLFLFKCEFSLKIQIHIKEVLCEYFYWKNLLVK